MSNNATPTGLSRRELWVDARDIQSGEGEGALSPEEYAQALETRGREKVAAALQRRGYRYDEIREALSQVTEGLFDEGYEEEGEG